MGGRPAPRRHIFTRLPVRTTESKLHVNNIRAHVYPISGASNVCNLNNTASSRAASRDFGLLAIACFCIAFFFSRIVLSHAGSVNMVDVLTFTLSEPGKQRAGETFTMRAILKNTGSETITFDVVETEIPFTVVISDQTGVQLNKNSHSLKKDRSTRNVHLTLRSGEEKAFKLVAGTYIDSSGSTKNLEPGIYTYAASFPVVRYVNSQYSVSLIEAKKVRVEITE